jgi:hypothetical protein
VVPSMQAASLRARMTLQRAGAIGRNMRNPCPRDIYGSALQTPWGRPRFSGVTSSEQSQPALSQIRNMSLSRDQPPAGRRPERLDHRRVPSGLVEVGGPHVVYQGFGCRLIYQVHPVPGTRWNRRIGAGGRDGADLHAARGKGFGDLASNKAAGAPVKRADVRVARVAWRNDALLRV